MFIRSSVRASSTSTVGCAGSGPPYGRFRGRPASNVVRMSEPLPGRALD